MPVIQLPKDDRWGQLGAGLGGLLGQAAGVYAQQQVDQGVASVIADDTIPQPAKLTTIQQRFGHQGVETYTNRLKADALVANLRNSDTENRLRESQIKHEDVLTQLLAPQVALAGDKAKADLAHVQATTDLTKAELPVKQAQVGEIAATTKKTQLEGQKLEQDITGTATNVEQIKELIRDPETAKAVIGKTISNPTDEEVNYILGQARGVQPSKMSETYNKAVTDIFNRRQARETAQITEQGRVDAREPPAALVKDVQATGQTVAAVDKFWQEFKKNPDVTGLLSGGSARAWFMNKLGLGADPQIASMYENELQTIASQISGGFFSSGRYNVAKDITPNLNKTPLGNIMAINAVAMKERAKLEPWLELAASPKERAFVQKQIDAVDRLQKETDGESYLANHGQQTVFILNGDVVDPKNLKPLVKAGETYTALDGTKHSGAEIIKEAKAHGLRPEDYIQQGPK